MKTFQIVLIVALISSVTAVTLHNYSRNTQKPALSYEPSQTTNDVITQQEVKPILLSSSFPVLSAQGVYVADIDSATTLYEKDANRPLLPASTTKIMTALVTMDAFPDSHTATVGKIYVDGQKMGLIEGERISVGNLLYGLLVFSANDAAEQLAIMYPGGKVNFIEAMNSKTRTLHLANTHFVNPSGLDGEDQVTTAIDLAKVALVGMDNPRFARIVGTKTITVTNTDGTIKHYLENVNKLLGTVEGIKGIKTGWTEAARENLVSYVERDGRRVVLVVLGSADRFGETKQLIDWVFENYSWN